MRSAAAAAVRQKWFSIGGVISCHQALVRYFTSNNVRQQSVACTPPYTVHISSAQLTAAASVILFLACSLLSDGPFQKNISMR